MIKKIEKQLDKKNETGNTNVTNCYKVLHDNNCNVLKINNITFNLLIVNKCTNVTKCYNIEY